MNDYELAAKKEEIQQLKKQREEIAYRQMHLAKIMNTYDHSDEHVSFLQKQVDYLSSNSDSLSEKISQLEHQIDKGKAYAYIENAYKPELDELKKAIMKRQESVAKDNE